MRIGFGYDIHVLVNKRPLILGGVHVPYARGLSGHSDADVLCHAINDALLGALALGDIGQHFPDTDPAWKDADSIEMMKQVYTMVQNFGYRLSNLDATIIAEHPKLAPYRDKMAGNIASALCVDPGQISVKATTNEQVDATGRGEAIAVHAVVLVEKLSF